VCWGYVIYIPRVGDGPIRTETCSPTINKVYIGHLLVVLDGLY